MNEQDFDKKWEKIYNERVENSHLQPSPETRERLKALEINQNNIMEKLNEFQFDNKEQHDEIRKALQGMEDKLDKALEKKANKWTEKAIVGFIIFILTGLGGYLGSLIYKAIIHIG